MLGALYMYYLFLCYIFHYIKTISSCCLGNSESPETLMDVMYMKYYHSELL
jgi:hypothetical protein